MRLNKIDSIIDVKLDLEGLCHLGSYFILYTLVNHLQKIDSIKDNYFIRIISIFQKYPTNIYIYISTPRVFSRLAGSN